MILFLKSLFVISFLMVANSSFTQDTIHWRANYKLKWEDFQGEPDNDSTLKTKAFSTLKIDYTTIINDSEFSYKVFCIFYKNESWVKNKSVYLLQHEQGHFDIAEIFARELQEGFKNYKFNRTTVYTDLETIYNNIFKKYTSFDSLYDKETNHSLNKKEQVIWLRTIAKQLNRANLQSH